MLIVWYLYNTILDNYYNFLYIYLHKYNNYYYYLGIYFEVTTKSLVLIHWQQKQRVKRFDENSK